MEPTDTDDADEDEDLIEAVRALAYMVRREDLKPFEGYLAPTDYLPPEERREAWLTSHYGEIDISGPAD